MPRKGNRKVRTGCLTCKVRKVKCDEIKPCCYRCTSTGRNCEGYAGVMKPDGMWTDRSIVLPRPTNYQSGRAFDYYHKVAGPGLSGGSGDAFWTKLLFQLSGRESAVRHAIMAISVMYEHYPKPQVAAVNHYNTAIRETLASADEELAIVMAIMFTCVEFLHGNATAATNHCRHAILIANKIPSLSCALSDTLRSILARLSVFPFFFGCNHGTFPRLKDLDRPLATTPMLSLHESRQGLEVLVARTVRFMRSTDKYRLGAQRNSQIPLDLYREQQQISLTLDNWHKSFREFQLMDKVDQMDVRQLAHLRMIYLVAKIWSSTTLERNECAYDKHKQDFTDIVTCAHRLRSLPATHEDQHKRPKFIFDMGFLPLLYFVVLKCRVLQLRVAALDCMKELSIDQEALWTANTLIRVARSLIQVEHEFDLDSNTDSWPEVIPAEEQRVRECMFDQETGRMTVILWRLPNELYVRTVAV